MMGKQLRDQPLSLHVLDKADRERMSAACPLTQPAASYEALPNKTDDAQLPWNPSLTTKYQTKFFRDSDLVLNRAWQLIPGSVLVGLLETVRTRVLRFALDLRGQLGPTAPTVEKLAPAAIERSVVNHIYAGNVLIAAHAENFSQLSQTNIAAGDSAALKTALRGLGITDVGIKQLETDMDAEKGSIGPRVKKWIADAGRYLGKEGAKAGVDMAKELAMRWILQYHGIG
jgi:hypothetical protein